jgi:hypothetical protein
VALLVWLAADAVVVFGRGGWAVVGLVAGARRRPRGLVSVGWEAVEEFFAVEQGAPGGGVGDADGGGGIAPVDESGEGPAACWWWAVSARVS